MSWERDLMSWERDEFFFTCSLSAAVDFYHKSNKSWLLFRCNER